LYFSHEPGAVPIGLQLLAAGNEVVIGARYPDGIIIGWPASRRVFSFLANGLARLLISWSIPDYTNGFRFYSPRAVDVLLRHAQQHKGYIYLSESLSVLLNAGLKSPPSRSASRTGNAGQQHQPRGDRGCPEGHLLDRLGPTFPAIMIFYDGSTGSLGFYFAGALEREGRPGVALGSRLGDTEPRPRAREC